MPFSCFLMALGTLHTLIPLLAKEATPWLFWAMTVEDFLTCIILAYIFDSKPQIFPLLDQKKNPTKVNEQDSAPWIRSLSTHSSYTGTGCASYFFCKDMNTSLVDKCFTCALAFGHTWADKDGWICDYCLAITGKNAMSSAFIQSFTDQLQRIQYPCSETRLQLL